MHTILRQITEKLETAFSKAFPTHETVAMEVTPSTQENFGHYQCNSAMKLASLLKKNPRQIAQELLDQFERTIDDKPFIASAQIAGPGFINFWIDPKHLAERLEQMLIIPNFAIEAPKEVKKILIDFSSPNVAKEMHVGHLRSTIIGDSIARLYEFLGHDVQRINHIGDWGTQFGMLIAFILEENCKYEDADLSSLMQWYQQSKKVFDENPAFKEKAKEFVVKLQSGEENIQRIWQKICEISSIAYQEIYQILDIKIEEKGESFYNPFLQALIEDLESKELLKESDGAKCLFLEGFFNREGKPLPMILQKTDGGFNYASTDLAALRYRVEEEASQKIIYVTDMGQKTHFQLLFSAAKYAQYDRRKNKQANDQLCKFEHVPFGLVLGPDGKKFKTRSGDTEKLIDLLQAAIEKSKNIFSERHQDWSTQKIQEAASILGIDAVKYADLSTHRCSDYQFSYDRMLQLEGNTAAFLLYAFVRMSSIQRKSKESAEKSLEIIESAEIDLALHLSRFEEALEYFKKELCPHYLSDYLYALAQKFNLFFRDCRVLDSEMQGSRLKICNLSSKLLSCGLGLLGLKTLEEM